MSGRIQTRWMLEKKMMEKEEGKQELESLFRVDFKFTSALPTHRTRVFKTRVATVNSNLRDSRC